jgi:hypothetical protein
MSAVTDIQMVLNDGGVFWPLQQVLDALNRAQMWVWGQTKWQRQSFPLPLAQGQDLLTLPSGVLMVGWIEGTVTNSDGTISKLRMFPTSQWELEKFSRSWRGLQTGQPIFFSIWDATTLRIFPRPDKAYTYTLWGLSYPTEIIDASTLLTGPPNYVHAVQNLALSMLFEATRPDLADMYLKWADEQVVQFKRHLRNQQGHNLRRLRPSGAQGIADEGLFTLNQSGTIRQLPVYYPLET